MAELRGPFVTAPTTRPPGSARPGRRGRVTPVARVPVQIAGASARAAEEGAVALGQVGNRLVDVLRKTDARIQAAQDVILAEQAESRFLVQSQTAEVTARKQQFIDVDALRTSQLEVQQREADTLSAPARARFLQTTNDSIFRQSAILAQENRVRTAREVKLSFGRTETLFHKALAQVRGDEAENAVIEEHERQSLAYVASGGISAARVQQGIDAAFVQQALEAIQVDPFQAETDLLAKTLGGRLSPSERQGVLDIAVRRQAQLTTREDRSDRQADKETADTQIFEASEHFAIIGAPDVSSATLEAQFTLINAKREQQTIRPQEFNQLTALITAKLRLNAAAEVTRREKDSVNLRAALEGQLYLSLSRESRDNVLDLAIADASQLTQEDFAAFIKTWNDFGDAEHITNQPEVREGLRLIGQAFTGAEDPSAISLILQGMSVKDRAELVNANVAYARRMEELQAGNQLYKARDEALLVIQRYLPDINIETPIAPQGAVRTAPVVSPVGIPPVMETMDYKQGLAHIRALFSRNPSSENQAYLDRLLTTWDTKHAVER